MILFGVDIECILHQFSHLKTSNLQGVKKSPQSFVIYKRIGSLPEGHEDARLRKLVPASDKLHGIDHLRPSLGRS